MGKTKYQSSWNNDYAWIKPSKKSIHHGFCVNCSTYINISAGVTQLQLHEKAKKHVESTNADFSKKILIDLDMIFFPVNHFSPKLFSPP